MEESKAYLRHILETFKCQDLIQSQQVIEIDASCSFTEACKILISNRISSAPVWDCQTRSYVGMFDYRDVVEYLLILFKRRPSPCNAEDLCRMAFGADGGGEGEKQGESAGFTSVKIAADISGKNPFYSLEPEDSLLAVVELLSNSGIHRVNVLDVASGKVIGIVSQTDVIRFVAGKHFNGLFGLLSQSIGLLGLVKAPGERSQETVVAVDGESSVIDAMTLMSAKQVTSVAVIESGGAAGGAMRGGNEKFCCLKGPRDSCTEEKDSISCKAEHNHAMNCNKDNESFNCSTESRGFASYYHAPLMIGCISMTDVKMIFQRNQYMDLFMTCSQWISAVLSQAGLENGGRDRCPVFFVRSASTLGEVMSKALATRVHRLWVEDELAAGHVIGVVSLGDILKVILQHYYNGTRIGGGE